MKKLSIFLCAALLMGTLTGCGLFRPKPTTEPTTTAAPTTTMPTTAPTTTTPTQGSTNSGAAGTQSAGLLSAIWELFPEEERFASYGGTVEHAVTDAPGDLDMKNTDELTAHYLIPQDRLAEVTEGASLVHMMNSNIFTAAVLKLSGQETAAAFAESWRTAIQGNRWICGQPDKLLMLELEEGHILMAFGSNDAMTAFRQRANEAYPQAKTLYEEAIVG